MGKRETMQYFIPEWDDLVDSEYNFWDDEPFQNSKKIYSHEIYDSPNYDGLLISRMKIQSTISKYEAIQKKGVHEYFKFDGPIFGDCGAWGYIDEKKPPFNTDEIIGYYDKLGFDIGVSIDHLCVPKYKSEWEYRKNISIKNAEEFYIKTGNNQYDFIPVGSAQGWDIKSYRDSVERLIDIGYDYIAIGGIAREKTESIIRILQSIKDLVIPNKINVHLFGVARLEAIRAFRELGVTSFDSASPLRSAWLGANKNYRGNNWEGYTALRLPFLTRSKKYKNKVKDGETTFEELKEYERAIQVLLRKFEFKKNRTPEEIIEAFKHLNQRFIQRRDVTNKYLKTLRDRPWEKCPCPICKEVGMEVIVFRGNNRNRRRGFHNTYVFYKILQKILDDPQYKLPGELKEKKIQQHANQKLLSDFLLE